MMRTATPGFRTRSRAIALTVAVATLVAGCGGHGGGDAREAAQLFLVGDSLAAGRFAATQDEAFPQRGAAPRHSRLELLAVPGATTAELAAQAVPQYADFVVVEAGTNDFLGQTPRRRF